MGGGGGGGGAGSGGLIREVNGNTETLWHSPVSV